MWDITVGEFCAVALFGIELLKVHDVTLVLIIEINKISNVFLYILFG